MTVQFDLGTDVLTGDGRVVGKVDRVILQDAGGTIQGVVVHKGTFLTRDLLVPVTMVTAVDEDGIHLGATEDQLDDLPDFIEDQYAYPPAGAPIPSPYMMGAVMFPLDLDPAVTPMLVSERKHLPPGSIDIAHGFTVRCTDDEVGIVRDVVVNADAGTIAYLVLDAGDEHLDRAQVPIELVADVSDEIVFLTCTVDVLRARVGRP